MMRKNNLEQSFHLVELHIRKKKRYSQFSQKIDKPSDVGVFFQEMIAYKDREWLCAIGLDAKGFANYVEVIHIGTLNQALVHPREVFKTAIVTNCNSVILAHNHPSGHVEPSGADIQTTKSLIEAGKMIGIEILDHLIVSDHNYYSIRENKTYYGDKNGK